MKCNDLVWFIWRGYLCVSPILKVNRKTVTVVVSDGERNLPKDRISRYPNDVRIGKRVKS